MKKYFFIITFLLFFSINNNSFAEDLICETKNWFDKYQCRVQQICNPYIKIDEKTKYEPVVITSIYPQVSEDYWIEEVKDEYRTNMNSIYSCWILKSQKKSLKNTSNLVEIEKSWELWDKIIKPIQERLSKIELSSKALKCKDIWDKIYNKQFVLQQTTYELCKYVNYLEYLKEYNSTLENSIKSDEKGKSFWISDLLNKNDNTKDEINNEIEHSFKVYPIVFNSYSEYENNFPIHILLELIRDDFATFRDKLYKTISPINQLVYKISNAMSIH